MADRAALFRRVRWSPAVALLLGGCQHFAAVQATGAVGERLAGHAVDFQAATALCLELNALTAAPANDCDARKEQAARWGRVASLLAAYAGKLSELAQKDDVTVEDQVGGALSAASEAKWGSLTADQNEGIKSLAQLVVRLLSQSYRSGVLEQTIKSADPHLQTAVAALVGHLDLLLNEVRAVEVAVDANDKFIGAATARTGPAPAGVSDEQRAVNAALGRSSRAGLVALRFELASRRSALEALRAQAASFGASHARLRQSVDDIDSKKLLADVLALIREVNGAAAAVRPAAPAGGGQ
jgi:hypothetical protein